MTNNISTREWEAISAYLDGQLAPKERDRLEERLKGNPELRLALNDLRRTRLLLRSQPRVRAPRNFTLTPEMVGRRPVARGYPAFRLVSAFASILLVIVLVGDLFSQAPRVMPSDAYALSPQQVEARNAAPAGMGGGAEGEPNAKAAAAPQATQAAEVQVESAPAAPEAQAPAAASPEMGIAEATPEGMLETAPMMGSAAEEAYPAPPPEASLTMGDQSQAEVGVAAAAPVEETNSPGNWLTRPVLRAVEVFLAILAIIAGAIAYILRRT